MVRFAAVILLALVCGPLAAAKLQLKSEPKAVESFIVKLENGQATIKRGARESTHKLDDFVPESAYEIKRQFTPREARALLELARFCLHRDLYDFARQNLNDALGLDRSLAEDTQAVVALLDTLQAEQLYREADALIEGAKSQADLDKARGLLRQAVEKFPATAGALKAEVVLQTLDRVATDLKARQLEEEARKAQAAADEEIRKKRAPIDEWLSQQDTQVAAWQTTAIEKAEKSGNDGAINDACQQLEDIIGKAQKLRDMLVKNRDQLSYPGQAERGGELEARAKKVQVECYVRWVKWLLAVKNFSSAKRVCDAGIATDPRERRLLAYRVDIDEGIAREVKPGKPGEGG